MDDSDATSVEAAFRAVPRDGFLPDAEQGRAAFDGPIAIGGGQTNSQPRTVADMLGLLQVRRGDHVLDVGAGSGWTTALLGHLTGPGGRVRGVELEPGLAAWGAENLAAAGMAWTSLEPAEPGVLGLPAHVPYQRILVSAEAGQLPDELVSQLDEAGRMVVPVAGVMTLVVRDGDDLHVSERGRYSFVPLRLPR